jgi:translation initiation factor 2 subunit 2
MTFLTGSGDKEVDEVADMFVGLNKKKKKSSKPKTDKEEAEADILPATGDGDFDASILKKKKKKSSKPKAADAGDFEAKLAEAGIEDPDTELPEARESNGDTRTQDGDLAAGTGIWAHNSTTPTSYPLLLSRFFTLLNQFNPDILSSGSKSYKIPPPQCLREGNKKTIFANIAEISKRMKRNDEHVTQFLFAELGTSGSVDGSQRLVIKGRFQQKQIENVLRRYIGERLSTPYPCLTNADDLLQSNMLRARRADRQIQNSTRARTDCISSRAIHAVAGDQ